MCIYAYMYVCIYEPRLQKNHANAKPHTTKRAAQMDFIQGCWNRPKFSIRYNINSQHVCFMAFELRSEIDTIYSRATVLMDSCACVGTRECGRKSLRAHTKAAGKNV